MKGLPLVFVCLVGSCFGQQTVGDKAFWGTWNMDVAKSKFAPGRVPPKSAQTVVNQNGYVATQEGGTGAPPSLAVALVRGECYLIGPFPPVVSCIVNTENPRRPIISIKEGDKVTRKSEVELVGETTLTVKTTIQTPGGTVLEEAVYTKAAPTPAPAKK
jgi:hypothetical protein